ncbi:MAG: DUF1800 family protein [Granulosicoccus sp.]
MSRNSITCILAVCSCLFAACETGEPDASAYVANKQAPAIAPALPATEVANAASDGPLTSQEAYRLLDQGTFGPTLQDVAEASELGPESWINQQMLLPATFLSEGLQRANIDRWNEYVNVWWRHAIESEDQLRQRVAFALSQILVVSAAGGLNDEQMGLANYYDILLRHAFGNYRDLLFAVTTNPVMGEYLSMKGNQKPNLEQNIQPDENYARELLQLFSIGQVLLNNDGTPKVGSDGVPIPAYDQNDIEAYARVFTGWQFANSDNFHWPSNPDYLSPMQPFEEFHDTEAKTLLSGQTTTAEVDALTELNQALDSIFYHPNVGPFISRLLIQRLVTSNPSPGYVSDVASVFNQNQAGERGSLASTVKAILMHNEARNGHFLEPETFGKLKEPLLRMTHLWRAFKPEAFPPDFNYGWAANDLAQAPLNSPSVFNFYRPDYSHPGEISNRGLVAPELQIHNETSIISMTNRLLAASIWSHNFREDPAANQIIIDISREMQLEQDPLALIDHLDLLLLGGRMSSELHQQIVELMHARNHENGAPLRVSEAIFLIVSSPEAAVQQ